MSEAEKRRDWRLWESGRDESALRRYVASLCREAPPTPEAQACVPRTHLIDEEKRPATAFRFKVVRSHLVCPRSVADSVRRLTVCGPWLPKPPRGPWRVMSGRWQPVAEIPFYRPDPPRLSGSPSFDASNQGHGSIARLRPGSLLTNGSGYAVVAEST